MTNNDKQDLIELAEKVAQEKHNATVRVPEPTVTFRARDILSTMVLNHYAHLLEIYNPYGEKAEKLEERIAEFRYWQQNNPDLVRLPD